MSHRIYVSIVALVMFIAIAVPVNADGSPSPIADKSGSNCTSKHNPHGIKLWIHVTKWCIVPGVRGQAQLKVQMRIHNRSDRRLYIGQERVRVILRDFDPDRWSPATIGQPTVHRPIPTTYGGQRVWAVPPNADGAYDIFPRKDEPTHATHWTRTTLGPKQTLNPHYHYGDLVFHMPNLRRKPRGWRAIDNIVGIAFVKGRDIVALCPPKTWGEHAPAGTF